MKTELKHIIIDDKFIKNIENSWSITEPVWYSGNIYDGYEKYEMSLKNFSAEQRYLFAMIWLDAEVCNGGFVQFFDNSTGIVWEDAYKGYKVIGAEKLYVLMEKVIEIFGTPSFDREKRWDVLENGGDELFNKLDECADDYYKVMDELEGKIVSWIKENPEKFYFEGDVEVYV